MMYLLLIAASSFAQPGTLDPSFGGDGMVTTKIQKENFGNSVAVQADGKIIVAGYSYDQSPVNFTLVRYLQDGMLDKSFGVKGKVVADFGTNATGKSVAILPDGNIIVAGSYGNSPQINFALAKFQNNGNPDSAFGTNGKVITDFGSVYGVGQVAIQTDGKIIVAGTAGTSPGFDLGLVRYGKTGKIDSTFGINGKVVTDLGHIEVGNSVAIQTDGKIVVAGVSYYKTKDSIVLVRYGKGGKIDSSFGTNGKVITGFGKYENNISLAIQPDGKILAAGSYLLRFNQNGKTDSVFGVNGKAVIGFASSSLAVQADGKIAVGGTFYNGSNVDFALARYGKGGKADSAFGVNGEVITDFGSRQAIINSVAIQADGKIVLAGTNQVRPHTSVFAVARYIGGNVVPGCTDCTKNNFSNFQIHENSKPAGIYLSPNPVKDILHIEGLSSAIPQKISVIDLSGKVLQQNFSSNSSCSFDIKQLPAGMYYVKIDEGGKTTSLKFIKE